MSIYDKIKSFSEGMLLFGHTSGHPKVSRTPQYINLKITSLALKSLKETVSYQNMLR